MKLNPFRLKPVRLGVTLLADRLAVAAVGGDRVEAFSIDGEDPVALLRDELAKRQIVARTVALGLARSSVFVKPIELPSVGADLREMVRLNLDGHLPFAADDAAFDFILLPAETESVRREEPLLRVLVAAAEPRVADAALRIAEEARLRPVSLTVAAHDLLALARPERGQRLIWVHRTGASADVLCLIGSTLVWSRTVPCAEEGEVPDEVRRTLAALRWRGCDAIWGSGDLTADALQGLEAPISEPAWTSRARARLEALPVENPGVNQLALAVAMGGARRQRPLDLLPRHLRPRRLTRAQATTVGMGAVTALLVVAALLVPGYRERRHLARINGEITRLDPQVRAVERVVRELERKRKLLTTVTGIEAGAIRPLPVLRDFTELMPSDAWLTTLSLDQKGVELTGQAAAASALIPVLENSPRLERVEFASPVTRGREKEQFRIRAAWEAGSAQTAGIAPASAPAPTPPGSAPPAAAPATPPAVAPGAPPSGPRRPQPGTAQVPAQPQPEPPPLVQPGPALQPWPAVQPGPAAQPGTSPLPARPGARQ